MVITNNDNQDPAKTSYMRPVDLKTPNQEVSESQGNGQINGAGAEEELNLQLYEASMEPTVRSFSATAANRRCLFVDICFMHESTNRTISVFCFGFFMARKNEITLGLAQSDDSQIPQGSAYSSNLQMAATSAGLVMLLGHQSI